jgi:hypothetical protein
MAQNAEGLTLSVVIPALNEEDGIAEIAQRVLATRSALRDAGVSDLELIVVDDGSVDGTARIVQQMEGVVLVRHTVNQGYGAAIKTGFGKARGELLAFLDADSTYPPEYFTKLCQAIVRDGADVAIGSRRSGESSGMPAIRRLGNMIWSNLLTLIGNARVQDPASGMRVLRRECLQQLYPLPDGLNFTPVMSTRSLHEDLVVSEIPIPYAERSGRSKLSVVRDGLRFLGTIVWTALQYNPARIFELAGFVAFSVAALIGGLFVVARLQGVTDLGPWGVFAGYVSLILAVGGVSLFSLGTSFNRLVALVHHRPIRQANLVGSVLGPAPERHFGWVGFVLVLVGVMMGIASLVLGLNGWQITRLWFWLLGSALFTLVGGQLMLFRMLIRVVDTLDEREDRIGADLERSNRAVATVHVGQPALTGSRVN